MIPVRVQVRNFLCYDEETPGEPIEFDFEGSPLWSISGDNGAGKSAIFDAITYALFGQHRGGAQEDARLIRKGAAGCEAAFEFRQNGSLYRVRRTVSRKQGKATVEPKTWQAAWFDPEFEDWRPVAGSESKVGLEHWVRERLGFGYETFTASVLLLQGQSDQLILAPPKKRFDILSGLLDLEPYRRLEAAAQERAKAARSQAQGLEGQVSALPAVTAEELSEAAAAAAGAASAQEAAQAAAGLSAVLVSEAQRYAGLQRELAEAEGALATTEGLLRDAERIRAEYEEWRRLSVAVPRLRDALSDLREARGHATRANEARTAADGVDIEALAQAAAAAEAEEAHAEQSLRELRARWEALAQALPLLREVVQRRRELSERQRALSERGPPEQWTTEVARLEEELGAREEEKARVEEARQRALAAEAEAQAALRQTEEQLSARREARDEAVCSRCGQPVDPEHIRRELEDAQRVVTVAQRQARAAGEARAAAEGEAAAALARLEAARHELTAAKQALEAAQRLAREEELAGEQLRVAREAAAGAPADLLAAMVERELVAAETALKGLAARDGELRQQAAAAEKEATEARQRARSAQKAQQDAVSGRQRLEAEARREEDRAGALRRQAEIRLADVDADWRQRALAGDDPFVQRLTARGAELEGIEDRHAVLERAAAERGRQEARIAEVRRGLESVAVEHRLPVEEAQARRAGAQALLDDSMGHRDEVRAALLRLEEGQERREALNRRLREVQRQRALYSRLADLLGRSGLQAFLLDAAVQGISHLANETLARISGGQLQLDVRRQASARGDEEIVIQATDLAFSDEPLDVQFVSGSQKFRTSVALAAAIGQYAGGGAGSVRSLIIDEGFGSLDSQGRQEMIDELHNLSQLVDRIIVVSHQEDFQDRTLFPTGYVLRKAGQRTEVERFV